MNEWERFEEVRESYEYALLIQCIDYLLQRKPEKRSVLNWAMKLTWMRKPSWHVSQIRQRENIQLVAENFKIHTDEEGEIIEVGPPESKWEPPFNPPDPSKLNSEEYLIAVENYNKVERFPENAGSLGGRKHAKLYQKILEMQLDGGEVLPEHGSLFGVSKDKIPVLKNQAIHWAKELIAHDDEQVSKNQAAFKAQKGKKRKTVKSTFRERQSLHRDPYYEVPRMIRKWRIIKGGSQGQTTPLRETKAESPNDPIAA